MGGSVTDDAKVFIVDDDACTRLVLRAMVQSLGYDVSEFSSAERFMETVPPSSAGCLVTDLRMPGMSGIELQRQIANVGFHLPVIVISGYATATDAVAAMQNGAVTLLEKPIEKSQLASYIGQAMQLYANCRLARGVRQELRGRLESLSESERQVMDGLLQGKANKQIARELDVSLRTVEGRRRAVFQKTQTDSIAALMQLVIQAREPRAQS